MAYNFSTLLANRKNYGNARKVTKDFYIVIHYTANRTDNAPNNAKYFHNNVTGTSAHYFIDANNVVRSVPDDYTAYAVGKDYRSQGGGSMYGIITNANSISIELTSVNGAIAQGTIDNAITCVKALMQKYGIPAKNVYRHYDVNGKFCPGWAGWIPPNESIWKEFKKRLESNIVQEPTIQPVPVEFKVKIKAATLNVMKGPSTKYEVVNTIKKNEVYTIVDVSNGWGLLKSYAKNRDGWISISNSYVKKS